MTFRALHKQFNNHKKVILMEQRSLCFDRYELEIIYEFLSAASCGHKRTSFLYHCCDAKEIVEKIESFLKEERAQD